MGNTGATDYYQTFNGTDTQFYTSGNFYYNTTGGDFEVNSPTGNASMIINADTNSNFSYLYLLEGLHQAYTGYTKYGIYFKYDGDTNDASFGSVQADVETDSFFMDRDTGNIGFGTASSPNKVLHAKWTSTDNNVATGNALGGGGVGKGVLIENSQGGVSDYANLDFRSGSADGRIAYQLKGTNNGDFHFVTDNSGSPISTMIIENEGAIRQPTDTKYYQGGASDVSFSYNSTDWVFNPREVGTGDGWLLDDWHVTGDLNVEGNTTSENVFIPQYMFAHNNATIPVLGVGVWTNITFDQEDSDIKYGITHVFDDSTNHTFMLMDPGVYDISYDIDVEDTSPSASDINVAVRVMNSTNEEVIGSVFEADITKQGAEVELSHEFLVRSLGNELFYIQFTASDGDVQVSTHGTYGDHPESASIVIKKVATL